MSEPTGNTATATPVAEPPAAPAQPATQSAAAATEPAKTDSTTTAQLEASSEPQKITNEMVKDMRMRRDVKGMRDLMSPKNGKQVAPPTKTEAQQQPVKAEATQTATPQPPEKAAPAGPVGTKKYVVGDGDSKMELHDPDGFLGNKDVDGLKKAAANQILRIKMGNKWLSEREAELAAERAEKDRLLAANRELQARIEQASSAKPGSKQTPTQQAAVTQPPVTMPSLEFKSLPQRPSVPADPTSWNQEQAEAMAKWETDLASELEARTKAVALAMKAVGNAAPNIDENHPVIQNLATRFNAIDETINQFKELIAETKATKERQKAQEVEGSFWNDVDQFVAAQDDYKLPASMREMHRQIADSGTGELVWMDHVAMANGLRRPAMNNPEQMQSYVASRNQLVQKYLDGDKQVIDRAAQSGINMPAGAREYFAASKAVNELVAERDRLVSLGILGPKATLQNAWRHVNERNLDASIRELEKGARSEGVKSVVDALAETQRDKAVVIPPDIAAAGQTPLTPERIKEIIAAAKQNPRDPEALKQLRELAPRKPKR